jgi:sulfate adenylyltransferase subunit 1
LGLQHIIIAVNKMDLVEYQEQAFNTVVEAYKKLAQNLNLKANLYFVPISALKGDNIVNKSVDMPWYTGETILEYLETMYINPHEYEAQNAKFAVQYVIRQDGSSINDFRGYMGRIEAGTINIGQTLYTANQQSTTVKQIFAVGGIELESASSGDNITLTLEHDIDISRGDILSQENIADIAIANSSTSTQITKSLKAKICWLDNTPSNANKYLLKHTTSQILAKISNIESILDISTLINIAHTENIQSSANNLNLKCNDIASVEINLQKHLIVDKFTNNALLGCFTLVDEVSHRTVAAGFIQ